VVPLQLILCILDTDLGAFMNLVLPNGDCMTRLFMSMLSAYCDITSIPSKKSS